MIAFISQIVAHLFGEQMNENCLPIIIQDWKFDFRGGEGKEGDRLQKWK